MWFGQGYNVRFGPAAWTRADRSGLSWRRCNQRHDQQFWGDMINHWWGQVWMAWCIQDSVAWFRISTQVKVGIWFGLIPSLSLGLVFCPAELWLIFSLANLCIVTFWMLFKYYVKMSTIGLSIEVGSIYICISKKIEIYVSSSKIDVHYYQLVIVNASY